MRRLAVITAIALMVGTVGSQADGSKEKLKRDMWIDHCASEHLLAKAIWHYGRAIRYISRFNALEFDPSKRKSSRPHKVTRAAKRQELRILLHGRSQRNISCVTLKRY